MSSRKRERKKAVTDAAIARRIGANVRHHRKERGLSQEALAFRADIHRTYVGFIERAESLPRVDVLLRIAGSLDVSVRDLLAGVRWRRARVVRGGLLDEEAGG